MNKKIITKFKSQYDQTPMPNPNLKKLSKEEQKMINKIGALLQSDIGGNK